MIEYFKDLPRKQKIGFICLVIAGLGFLFSIISGAMSSDDTTPTPTPSTPSVSSTENPTATATPSPTATASATAKANPTAMPEIKYGDNKIPVSEIRALQDVASKGITAFLEWPANETIPARAARLAPYFTDKSELVNQAPNFQKATEYETENGQSGMVSLGSVDYINPVGGDESTYRLTMGTVLRAQYNYEKTGTEKSGVVQSSETLTVDMTKINGAWKIKNVSQD